MSNLCTSCARRRNSRAAVRLLIAPSQGPAPDRRLDVQTGRRQARRVTAAAADVGPEDRVTVRGERGDWIRMSTTDGGPSWQLTQGEKSCDDPRWSHDGRWIAFVSNRAGKKNLWLIQADGGEAVQLSPRAECT